MIGMDREDERVVEMHWRTTKVRVWGREANLWSYGKRMRVDREGEGEISDSGKEEAGGK